MKKYSIVFFLLVLTALQSNAQDFKTDESIGEQLKNNIAPGAKYAPVASRSMPQVQPHTTLVEEIKNGKYAPVKTGSGSFGSRAEPAAHKAGTLPSDQSAMDAAREIKPTQKASLAQTPPTQEGSSRPSTELKGVPSKNAKLIPVKKDQQ